MDNVAFSLFGISIYWYGLVYAVGFFLGYLAFMRSSLELKEDEKEHIFLVLLVCSIVGGRLFEALYVPSYYISDWTRIFLLHQGGMSIHGGLAGAGLALVWASRRYQVSFFSLSDYCVKIAVIFFALGRVANYLNREIVGRVIENPAFFKFGMYFKDDQLRYALPLYLAVKNALVGLAIFPLKRKGLATAWFLMLFNAGRFFLDFFKEPYGIESELLVLVGLTLGQVFSLCFIVLGAGMLVYRATAVAAEKL